MNEDIYVFLPDDATHEQREKALLAGIREMLDKLTTERTKSIPDKDVVILINTLRSGRVQDLGIIDTLTHMAIGIRDSEVKTFRAIKLLQAALHGMHDLELEQIDALFRAYEAIRDRFDGPCRYVRKNVIYQEALIMLRELFRYAPVDFVVPHTRSKDIMVVEVATDALKQRKRELRIDMQHEENLIKLINYLSSDCDVVRSTALGVLLSRRSEILQNPEAAFAIRLLGIAKDPSKREVADAIVGKMPRHEDTLRYRLPKPDERQHKSPVKLRLITGSG